LRNRSVSSREGPRLLFRTCLIGDIMEIGRLCNLSPQVHAMAYEHEPMTLATSPPWVVC